MNSLCKLFLLILLTNNSLADTAVNLLNQGEIEQARALFLEELKDHPDSWNSLMRIAWFEDTVSEHRKAIEYSNRALEIAKTHNNNFKIGRSLCWLGWAYLRLGLYELALKFLENAIEIGAPKGKIEIPHVWGLATQEVGAIYFRQGDTAGALEKLQSSYKLAEELGVATGIAEGGAHLAEIYLSQGNFKQAEFYITSAINNIEKAPPDIRGKIHTTAARIWLKKAELNNEYQLKASELIKSALNYCSKKKLSICHAEALLLQSQTIPYNHFSERHQLVSDAFEILSNKEHELRGLAEAELGRVYLENDRKELAKFYIENGVKVDKELFRKIDRAFLNKELADLASKNGEIEKQKNKLIKSIDAALGGNLLPQALNSQKELSSLYEKQGYFTAALQWNREAQKTIIKIKEQSPTQEENDRYEIELLKLQENAIFLTTLTREDRKDL